MTNMVNGTTSRAAAQRLAQRFNDSKDGPTILRLLRDVGLIAPPSRTTAPTAPLPDAPAVQNRVGIWVRSENDGVVTYVRDRAHVEGHLPGLWAHTAAIPSKGAGARVMWLGESVARGFFFDPYYCPALVLESVLQSVPALHSADVVDLGRGDQSVDGLIDLMRASLQLKPDVFVVLAGNNLVTFGATAAIAASLDDDAELDELEDATRAWLRQESEHFIARMAEVSRESGVPVIMLLPEFNLRDWDSGVPRAPVLPDDGNARWTRLRSRASSALSRSDLAEAEALAREMVEIDGGRVAASIRMLAECRAQQGFISEAKALFDRAKDAELWKCEVLTPRCYGVVQDTFRSVSEHHGLVLIDLPAHFADWLDGGIPDRRLFLDYCHLSAEGIQVTVAAAAERVVRLLTGEHLPWRELVSRCPAPTTYALGHSHLEAAVHNAGWGQGDELVQFHAVTGARLAPELVETCRHFSDLSSRALPQFYARAFHELVQTNDTLVGRAFQVSGRMNVRLNDALALAFAECDPEYGARIADIRKTEFGVQARTRDLLEGPYAILSWVQPERDWWNRAAFYKAYDVDSRFIVVSETPAAICVRFVARIPRGPASLAVTLNGEEIFSGTIGGEWTDVACVADTAIVREGLNELIVRWPIDSSGRDGGRRQSKLFYPVFGELFTLIAEGST